MRVYSLGLGGSGAIAGATLGSLNNLVAPALGVAPEAAICGLRLLPESICVTSPPGRGDAGLGFAGIEPLNN